MGHDLTAIIGNRQTLAALIARFGPPDPVALPFDLVIVPLDWRRLDALALSVESVFDGFTYLTPALADAIGRSLGVGRALYLETACFGGMGGQGAALFDNSALLWKKTESTFPLHQPRAGLAKTPISEGLAALGVIPAAGQDAFDAVGLARFRNLESFGSDQEEDG